MTHCHVVGQGGNVLDPLESVYRYHEVTKHLLERYAPGPDFLDWDTQPDPFRRFSGARCLDLDEVPPGRLPAYDDLFADEPGRISPRPVDRATLSQLFYDSLALSAWKSTGRVRWSMRVNPSSGDLHPTEGYLVTDAVDGLIPQAGVYHYAPYKHALEERFLLAPAEWRELGLPAGALLVGLTSIYWREAWKYGARAFRYCQHDVGHAIAAVTIAARVLGWQTFLLERPVDRAVAALLGIDRQTGIEAEHPECLLLIMPEPADAAAAMERDWEVSPALLEALANHMPPGVPNQLSSAHRVWDVIDSVDAATTKRTPPGMAFWHRGGVERASESCYGEQSARRIIRQRRSALAMDGRTVLPKDYFYRMLHSVMAEANSVVFHTLPWRPCVHLVVFVHRVEALDPGLYLLVRRAAALEWLRSATAGGLLWERVEDGAAPPTLYRLHRRDYRTAARIVSCHQDIASDGAFALGMLAEFQEPLEGYGPWFYKRLYWETGVIGQVLYLEAEAAGIRATGIGCFFDDIMHELLGLQTRRLQSLYHFTVGGYLDDPRLNTEPAYAHRHD